MTNPVIRLDRSKAFSECRGERTPDDPHYRVHFWQGGKVGERIVLLPFDAQGLLVPDDGKKEPFMGLNVDAKQVEYRPLYDEHMRALVERKLKRMAQPAKSADFEDEGAGAGDGEAASLGTDDVNLESWLRGEAQYQPHQIRTAMKTRFHRSLQNINDIVIDLVLDEKLVAEDQVTPALARCLPNKAA